MEDAKIRALKKLIKSMDDDILSHRLKGDEDKKADIKITKMSFVPKKEIEEGDSSDDLKSILSEIKKPGEKVEEEENDDSEFLLDKNDEYPEGESPIEKLRKKYRGK